MSKIISYTELDKLKFSPDGNNFLIFQGIPSHDDAWGHLCLDEALTYSVRAWNFNSLVIGVNEEINKEVDNNPAELKFYLQDDETNAQVKYNKIYNILVKEFSKDPRTADSDVFRVVAELATYPEKEKVDFIKHFISEHEKEGRGTEVDKIFQAIAEKKNYSIEYNQYNPERPDEKNDVYFYPNLAALLKGHLTAIRDEPIPVVVVLKDDKEVKRFLTKRGDGLMYKKYDKSGFTDYMLKRIQIHVRENKGLFPKAAAVKTIGRPTAPRTSAR